MTIASTPDDQTTVTVRCTGHVRDTVGTHELEYQFPGRTLRSFLTAFFTEYDVADLIMAHDGDETTRGWAPKPDSVSGRWAANPDGENTRPYARVCVNGRFNEHIDGLDTVLADGDRVALLKPFLFCC